MDIPHDPSVLDFASALARVDGDLELLTMLAGMAPEQFAERVLALEAAWTARDGTALSREAHALKGTAGAFGAVAVMETCARIEQAARSGDWVELADARERLGPTTAAALAQLAQLAASPDGFRP